MSILKDMNWVGDFKIKPEVMDEQQRVSWDSGYNGVVEKFAKAYPDRSNITSGKDVFTILLAIK